MPRRPPFLEQLSHPHTDKMNTNDAMVSNSMIALHEDKMAKYMTDYAQQLDAIKTSLTSMVNDDYDQESSEQYTETIDFAHYKFPKNKAMLEVIDNLCADVENDAFLGDEFDISVTYDFKRQVIILQIKNMDIDSEDEE